MLREMFPDPDGVPEKVFTATELAQYDGKTKRTNGLIYIAVNDVVYDITAGAKFTDRVQCMVHGWS